MARSLRSSLPRYIPTGRLTLELWAGTPEHYATVIQVMNETPHLAANGIDTPEKWDQMYASCRVSPGVFTEPYEIDTDVIYLTREGGKDGPLVGVVSLAQRKHSLPPGAGWAMKKEFWGKGYASEAAKAFIGVLRDRFGVTEMLAWPLSTNMPSIRTAEKVGFVFGGEVQDDKGEQRTVYMLQGTKMDFGVTYATWRDKKPTASK